MTPPMKLPEMPSYPYIGQDWDDTARLLLGDWGKACYVAGEKQERALWELTKAGEALGEPAATPVVPPLAWTVHMQPNESCRYNHTSAETPFGRFLITWKGWKEHDDPAIDETPWGEFEGAFYSVEEAQKAAAEMWRAKVLSFLAASPSPRTPEQPEQRPDSDHPVGE